MARIFVKFYDNEHNIVMVPVSDTDPVPVPNLKPAESYSEARKRNYRPDTRNRLVGSVLLSGRS